MKMLARTNEGGVFLAGVLVLLISMGSATGQESDTTDTAPADTTQAAEPITDPATTEPITTEPTTTEPDTTEPAAGEVPAAEPPAPAETADTNTPPTTLDPAPVTAQTAEPAAGTDTTGDGTAAPVPQTEAATAEDDTTSPDTTRRVRRLGDRTSTGEWEPDFSAPLVIPEPAAEVPAVNLPNADRDLVLQDILLQLAYDPENPEAQQALADVLNGTVDLARANVAAGQLTSATTRLNAVDTLDPGREDVAALRTEIDNTRAVAQLLAAADEALQDARLIAPVENNAVYYYQQVQGVEPENPLAAEGLTTVETTLLEQARAAADELDFETASLRIEQARSLQLETGAVQATLAEMDSFRDQRADELEQQVAAAIAAGEFEQAETVLDDLVALGDYDERILVLRDDLQAARAYAGFTAGQVLQDDFLDDGNPGPPVVVMPVGSFLMGADANETGSTNYERPRHRVTFNRGFAIGQRETTVGEFRRFVQDTGYRTDAERDGESTIYDEESGRLTERSRITWEENYLGRRADSDEPVLHVSWNDAMAYVTWLSEKTGQVYRLPTEAEFEYANRAGTQSLYWWGDDSPDNTVTNTTGDGDVSGSRRRWTVAFDDYRDGFWGPAPVASFTANPFGLFDMSGNVSEWVMDCWHDNYVRAPADGGAWVNAGCNRRVVRGGSWGSSPDQVRSAFRIAASDDSRGSRVGFRIAREL